MVDRVGHGLGGRAGVATGVRHVPGLGPAPGAVGPFLGTHGADGRQSRAAVVGHRGSAERRCDLRQGRVAGCDGGSSRKRDHRRSVVLGPGVRRRATRATCRVGEHLLPAARAHVGDGAGSADHLQRVTAPVRCRDRSVASGKRRRVAAQRDDLVVAAREAGIRHARRARQRHAEAIAREADGSGSVDRSAAGGLDVCVGSYVISSSRRKREARLVKCRRRADHTAVLEVSLYSEIGVEGSSTFWVITGIHNFIQTSVDAAANLDPAIAAARAVHVDDLPGRGLHEHVDRRDRLGSIAHELHIALGEQCLRRVARNIHVAPQVAGRPFTGPLDTVHYRGPCAWDVAGRLHRWTAAVACVRPIRELHRGREPRCTDRRRLQQGAHAVVHAHMPGGDESAASVSGHGPSYVVRTRRRRAVGMQDLKRDDLARKETRARERRRTPGGVIRLVTRQRRLRGSERYRAERETNTHNARKESFHGFGLSLMTGDARRPARARASLG